MSGRAEAIGQGSGRVALVTGASSGIGAATAVELARRGYVVGLAARRKLRLAEVLDRCLPVSPDSRMWSVDLSDLGAAESLVHQAWNSFGHIDVLVNNAGIPMRKPVDRLTFDEVEQVMRVNYLSPVRMILAVLPHMIERDSGVIVNVASLGGRLGNMSEAAYSASKFALCGFSESMAVDLYGTGVKVRLVNPGAIETEIWDQPGNDAPLYQGPFEPASDVATGIADAIDSDRFEHYLPDMSDVIKMKTADIDGFMAGMAAWAAKAGT